MIEVRTGKITFPKQHDYGPQDEDETQTFSNPIKDQNFAVILTGFEVKFDDDEHEFHLAEIAVEGTKKSDSVIEVKCTLGLRDHTKYWDDYYSGYVAYTVIAETET